MHSYLHRQCRVSQLQGWTTGSPSVIIISIGRVAFIVRAYAVPRCVYVSAWSSGHSWVFTALRWILLHWPSVQLFWLFLVSLCPVMFLEPPIVVVSRTLMFPPHPALHLCHVCCLEGSLAPFHHFSRHGHVFAKLSLLLPCCGSSLYAASLLFSHHVGCQIWFCCQDCVSCQLGRVH